MRSIVADAVVLSSIALASILNGTTPLFTMVLAHFLTDDDHLTPAKVGGVVLYEQLSWNMYAGFGLILLGVMAANGLFKGRILRRGQSLQAEFGD